MNVLPARSSQLQHHTYDHEHGAQHDERQRRRPLRHTLSIGADADVLQWLLARLRARKHACPACVMCAAMCNACWAVGGLSPLLWRLEHPLLGDSIASSPVAERMQSGRKRGCVGAVISLVLCLYYI